MKRTLAIALGATAVALAAPVSPASAAFTLKLSAPEPAVVGKPMVLQATGTNEFTEYSYLFWFSLAAIPTSVTTTCPDDHYVGAQMALGSGGSIIVFTQRESMDAAGNFTIPVAVTPTSAGSLLLCGYTDDGLTNTMAKASLVLDIKQAGSPPQDPTPPSQNPPPPPKTRWNTASIRADAVAGIKGCRALLRRPAACERKIVRLANSRCRRLGRPQARTKCLRAVRRVAARR
jgi:hypothetical protein